MGVAIGAADFFAGGADGQQAVQGVLNLTKHFDLDAKAEENEDRPGQKDEADEEFADKGEAQGKDPGHHAVAHQEEKHQPAVQPKGADDFRLAALGDEGGEDVQFPGLDKADEHDNCSGKNHGDAQDVLHGEGTLLVI